MMKSITLLMDSARDYDEAQINALIRRWKRDVAPAIETDHVSVRRLLVDRGQLERSADGRVYRVGFPPGPMAFDLEIDELDLVATITAYRDHVSRERERREAEHAEGRPERS